MLSFSIDTAPQSFCHSFIALSITCCWKSVQKSAVQVCQVAIVAMETTQLVLSQIKNVLVHELRIEWGLLLPKIISKCCELVKLCHINRCGPIFLRHTVCLYLAPFLRYSTSKNGVPLRPVLRVIQGHSKWHHWMDRIRVGSYCSCSNYGPTLYHFRDKAKYLSENRDFSIPTCTWRAR